MGQIEYVIKSITKIMDTINRIALLLSTVGFAGLCFIQVICRYVFNNSLTWSEQACRYLFCITVFLGAALCVAERKHTRIDILEEFLSPKQKYIQNIIIHLLMLGFSIVLVRSGWTLATKNMYQVAAALPIKMGAVYMMIPCSGVIMAINTLRVIFQDMHDFLKYDKNVVVEEGAK